MEQNKKQRLIDASGWDSFYADMGDSHNMMDSYDRGYTDALDNADDWMDAQPTVDAVEVVRCQDCEAWNEAHECEHFSMRGLGEFIRDLIHITPPDFYCKAGRKRVPNEEQTAE